MPMAIGAVVRVVEGLALLVGLVAVAALVHGSAVLVQETRIVVYNGAEAKLTATSWLPRSFRAIFVAKGNSGSRRCAA